MFSSFYTKCFGLSWLRGPNGGASLETYSMPNYNFLTQTIFLPFFLDSARKSSADYHEYLYISAIESFLYVWKRSIEFSCFLILKMQYCSRAYNYWSFRKSYVKRKTGWGDYSAMQWFLTNWPNLTLHYLILKLSECLIITAGNLILSAIAFLNRTCVHFISSNSRIFPSQLAFRSPLIYIFKKKCDGI